MPLPVRDEQLKAKAEEDERELLYLHEAAPADADEQVEPSDLAPKSEPAVEEAPTESAKSPEPVFPLAEPGPYYTGLWGKHPNYGCPYCSYATLSRSGQDGNGLIELHILERIDLGDASHMAALNTK